MARALDALVLGSFVFEGFAVTEKLPYGGAQAMKVHKIPGGTRTIDTAGPDDRDREFTAAHWGANALKDSKTLDAMRIAGTPLAYSNGVEARTVVISQYLPNLEKFTYIPFQITLVPVDNPAAVSASATTVTALAQSDLSSVQATMTQNSADDTPVTTPVNSAGIGSA